MLAPKSIALLIAGVIIISTLFSVFQVTYPTGNPVLEPIQPKQYQLFKYQFTDKNLLGNTTTNFAPSGNGTVTIEGYVYSANGSTKTPLSNSYLYAAVFPAESDYFTNSNGFFQITVIKYGQGTFAFQVPGFNPEMFKISLLGTNVYWLNITLNPAQKYNISGKTVDQSGHSVPGVSLTFSDFIQEFYANSSKSGDYSLSLYNGTYVILVSKSGFSNTPTPSLLTVNGKGKSNFVLTLKPLSTPIYFVSGYVHNVLGSPIKGATVTSTSINNTVLTNSSGFYKVKVPVGLNTIVAMATGYGYNYTQVYVQSNLTDVNLTLTSSNPFGNSGGQSGSGLSGIPPGTVKNITGALGNSTSTINYGNNTTSGSGSSGNGNVSRFLLQGNVVNKNNSAPVVNTYLYFYVNVNGTYFYESVMTNSTGHYQLGVSYTGHYHFYVYSPLYENYSFSLWFNSSSWKNFSLSPDPGTTYNLSGHVFNALDGAGIPAIVTVFPYGSLNPMIQVNSNSSGFYHLYLIRGNYSASASSYGFATSWNNSTLHPFDSNLIKNFKLDPVSSVGAGTSLWGNNTGTGIPGVSSSNVSSQLNSSSGGNSLATGGKVVSLTMHMVNATNNNQNISNTPYELFLKLNSIVYKYNSSTNSTGNSTIVLGYEGNYSLLVETFYYYGKVVSINLTSNTSIVMDLYPRAVFPLSITLANAYNISSGVNVTVPYNYLNITNYKQGSYRMTQTQIQGVGTIFNYTMPDGNYSFTYSNVNYVTHSFFSNVSGAYYHTTQLIKPYLIIVNSNTSAQFTYNLGGLGISPSAVVTVNSTSDYRAFYAGESSTYYTFYGYLGGNMIYPDTFELTPSSPVSELYLNVTSHSKPESVGNFNYVRSGNSYIESVPYNYTNTQHGYIYQAYVNYTIGSSASLSIDGVKQTSDVGGGTFYLNKYYNYTGGLAIIDTNSIYNSFNSWYNAEPSINSSVITIYYYSTTFLQHSSSGGS